MTKKKKKNPIIHASGPMTHIPSQRRWPLQTSPEPHLVDGRPGGRHLPPALRGAVAWVGEGELRALQVEGTRSLGQAQRPGDHPVPVGAVHEVRAHEGDIASQGGGQQPQQPVALHTGRGRSEAVSASTRPALARIESDPQRPGSVPSRVTAVMTCRVWVPMETHRDECGGGYGAMTCSRDTTHMLAPAHRATTTCPPLWM